MSELKNLVSDTKGKDIVVYPKDYDFAYIAYNQPKIQLEDAKSLEDFVRAVKTFIRRSEEYDIFKKHIIQDHDMIRCSLYSNITIDMAPLEMHHGPIFTIEDYVKISIIYQLKNSIEVNTFTLFDRVMGDHFNHIVQVIMLSEMAHAAVHPKVKTVKPEFVSMDSAFGDLIGYLTKYAGCFLRFHKQKLMNYLYLYETYNKGNYKSEIFKEVIKSWKDYEKGGVK